MLTRVKAPSSYLKKRTHEGEQTDRIMKKWRSKRARHSTLPNSSDLTTIADLPLNDDDKISIPEFYMDDLCSPAFDVDGCRMSDVQALSRPGEITSFSMKIFNIISTPPRRNQKFFPLLLEHQYSESIGTAHPAGRSIRDSK